MEMSYRENWIMEEQYIFFNIVYHILFPQTVHTVMYLV